MITTSTGFSQSVSNQSDSEPVHNMSAFEVSAGSVNGYATTSSTTASRVAAPITELSTSVIVINEKLIEDVMAVSVGDTLDLIGGVSASAEAGSFQQNKFSMRGYVQATGQRDGFSDELFGENGGFDYVFVDRMEVVKGPNGILYGEHSPGGVLNIISKRPLAKPQTKVNLMYGSNNYGRADIDTSGFIDQDNRWGYRVSAGYSNTDGPLDHPGDSNKGFIAINPTVRYRSDSGLEVWAWAGFVRDESPRLRKITRTFLSSDGSAAPLFSISDDGGAHNVMTNRSKVETNAYEIGMTKSFDVGEVRMDLRLLARQNELLDTNDRVRTSGLGGGTDTFVDANDSVIGRDSRTIDIAVAESSLAGFFRNQIVVDGARHLDKQTNDFASDLNLAFDLGSTSHRLLLFGSYNETDSSNLPGYGGFNYTINDLTKLQDLGVEVVNGIARIWLYPLERAPVVGISIADAVAAANSVAARPTTVQSSEQSAFGIVERMGLFDDRLFLVGSLRHNSTDINTQAGTAAANATSDSTLSHSLGTVFKAYKGEWGEVALFYNQNETYVPVYSVDQRLATFGEKFPNRTVGIKEFGVKFDLMDSRLVTTLSAYKTIEENVLISYVDEDGTITGLIGSGYSVPSAFRKIDGWEIDLSYNIAPGFDSIVSYGKMDGVLEDGRQPGGQPSATAAALLRYEVQRGALKGVSLLWQYKWWGDSILNSRTYWTIPSGGTHALVLGYKRGDYRLGLRIDNVFDRDELLPGTNETAVGVTDDRGFRLSLSRVW